MKRPAFLFLLLLTSGQAFGEAFKNGRIEDFLGAALLLLFGAPIAIGLAVYGLMRLTDQDYTANLALTLFLACATWWLGMLILFNMSANAGRFWFLEVCATAGAAAAGYYLNRVQKPDL